MPKASICCCPPERSAAAWVRFSPQSAEHVVHPLHPPEDLVLLLFGAQHGGQKVLLHGEAGEHPRPAPHLHDALLEAQLGIGVGDGAAVEPDGPPVGHAQPTHRPQQGGLARPVGAQQGQRPRPGAPPARSRTALALGRSCSRAPAPGAPGCRRGAPTCGASPAAPPLARSPRGRCRA